MSANLTAPAARIDESDLGGKHACACSDGCSGLTWKIFSQGHDARLVTRLRNQVMDPAHPMTTAEALAELQRRGGFDGLLTKLERAIANAALKAADQADRKAAKAAARATKAPKAAPRKVRQELATFELGEFCLASMPLATETQVVAKVGRWERRGEVVTYQVVENGKPSKGDTVLVFEYRDKKGEPQMTTSYSRVATDEDFAAAAPEPGLRRVRNDGSPIPAEAPEAISAEAAGTPF